MRWVSSIMWKHRRNEMDLRFEIWERERQHYKLEVWRIWFTGIRFHIERRLAAPYQISTAIEQRQKKERKKELRKRWHSFEREWKETGLTSSLFILPVCACLRSHLASTLLKSTVPEIHHLQSYFVPLPHTYRAPGKSMYFWLSRTQAGPGRTVKQEQEEISHNHVQTFSGYHRTAWNSGP